jgi:hypothetical protein
MNAIEKRNELRVIIVRLADHMLDCVDDAAERFNQQQPGQPTPARNWRGVGDLESVAHQLARICSELSNHTMTPEQFLADAQACAANCRPR